MHRYGTINIRHHASIRSINAIEFDVSDTMTTRYLLKDAVCMSELNTNVVFGDETNKLRCAMYV